MYKLLNREGSKFRYLDKILPLFPNHNLFMEPFLGTGCIILNKEKSSTEIASDKDDFIFDFFNCFRENPERLMGEVEETYLHPRIIKDLVASEDVYVRVAGRLCFSFVAMYTNFDGTIADYTGIGSNHGKALFLKNIRGNLNFFKNRLKHVLFSQRDVFEFLEALQKRHRNSGTFVYCDPPYLTSSNLKSNKGWTSDHLERLITLLLELNVSFMISEYLSDDQLNIFKKYGLFVEPLAKSTGLPATFGHEKIECVAMNYKLNRLF